MKLKRYVRVVASGKPWPLPTPPGNRRKFMYVCVYEIYVILCLPFQQKPVVITYSMPKVL